MIISKPSNPGSKENTPKTTDSKPEKDMDCLLRGYLGGLSHCLEELTAQDICGVAELIYQAYTRRRQIFIVGNGGSASTASHMARDLRIGTSLRGKPRLRTCSLADNVAFITSLANDVNYESIFTEQLIGQIEPGDVLIAISCSGNSANVVRAAEYANECGASTVGLTGFGGGRLLEICDICVVLSSCDYGQVEDVHLSLGHIFSCMVKARIEKETV
ncbi:MULTISPECIES: SIS domain-containing protein [Dehalococcoides]|jgi:D-sedoheptulose 7-phosphate isomerase|uniref:Phosphoheptose isomerase n=1 Tax=Dehalococcoides mccartyi TaxID=61435 RepID=A0A328ENY3_9CHLR|nr:MULTISPECIES: SIS domain-containing protein [Dehalococcoides]AGG05841.1 sugar isomerase superfamily protein [Dehalococcoides mccartyi DCMB5]PKH47527.1 phosphoheptose isomerase [Dehalococcoides mccartyi]RAL69318.1 Phosphoheptose isomerase [Dehalococcoides mccartyi]BAS31325.1 sugar isomerase (SIS) [Dehalococcoides mccartyi IBARAKI]